MKRYEQKIRLQVQTSDQQAFDCFEIKADSHWRVLVFVKKETKLVKRYANVGSQVNCCEAVILMFCRPPPLFTTLFFWVLMSDMF